MTPKNGWIESLSQDDHSALLAMSKLAHVLVAAAAHGRASPVAAADALRASAQRHQKVFGTNSPQALKATDDLTNLRPNTSLRWVGGEFFRSCGVWGWRVGFRNQSDLVDIFLDSLKKFQFGILSWKASHSLASFVAQEVSVQEWPRASELTV